MSMGATLAVDDNDIILMRRKVAEKQVDFLTQSRAVVSPGHAMV